MNPFEIFQIPVNFVIDWQEIDNKYLALQKIFHPDNFATASSLEKRLAMQQSAQINDALQILKNPILRAEAIIQIHTGKIIDIETQTNFDMPFLMQQMAWREQLEEITNNKNTSELECFFNTIKQEEAQILNELQNLLENHNWEQAEKILHKLRYISKLISEINHLDLNF